MASKEMAPHILILAAGASSRMGGPDKLLLPLSGRPLLAHVAEQALGTGLPVTVTLLRDRPLRQAALDGLPVQCLQLADAAGGMGASLARGVATLPDLASVLVVLGDMPDITTSDLILMLRAWEDFPNHILRATGPAGALGHPVGFPPWSRPELLRLAGDAGARTVLMRHPDRLLKVALPGDRALIDVDTPEDWQKWQGRAT